MDWFVIIGCMCCLALGIVAVLLAREREELELELLDKEMELAHLRGLRNVEVAARLDAEADWLASSASALCGAVPDCGDCPLGDGRGKCRAMEGVHGHNPGEGQGQKPDLPDGCLEWRTAARLAMEGQGQNMTTRIYDD